MPGTVPIADAPERQTVRVAGEVRHIIVKPGEPFDELEAVLYDGSGDLLVVWLGRRSIRGLTLGSRVIAEGVIGETAGQRRMLDPAFELVPPGPR